MKAKSIRSYLLTGLVVWLPILVTFGVLRFIVDLLDQTLALLPNAYQPRLLLGFNIPGFGVVLSLVLLISTGIIATNFLGARIVHWGEALLARIPLVRSVYNAAKQVIQAIFSTSSQAFRKVVMVEYPRAGMWSIGFITSSENLQMSGEEEGLITVFIPTTPIPTSGYIIMVAESQTKNLNMSVDEALKWIISLGVMSQPFNMIAQLENINNKKVEE